MELLRPCPTGDGIVEARSAQHLFPVQDMISHRTPRFAHAELSRRITEERPLEARHVLESDKTNQALNNRIIAGYWLYDAVGVTNDLITLIDEGFSASDSHIGQTAAHVADKIGPLALPTVPTLKRALWHKDKFVRARAGMLLRKLAPHELEIDRR